MVLPVFARFSIAHVVLKSPSRFLSRRIAARWPYPHPILRKHLIIPGFADKDELIAKQRFREFSKTPIQQVKKS
jgi:hypothetical protein